jgi:hypothetical protein
MSLKFKKWCRTSVTSRPQHVFSWSIPHKENTLLTTACHSPISLLLGGKVLGEVVCLNKVGSSAGLGVVVDEAGRLLFVRSEAVGVLASLPNKEITGVLGNVHSMRTVVDGFIGIAAHFIPSEQTNKRTNKHTHNNK